MYPFQFFLISTFKALDPIKSASTFSSSLFQPEGQALLHYGFDFQFFLISTVRSFQRFFHVILGGCVDYLI